MPDPADKKARVAAPAPKTTVSAVDRGQSRFDYLEKLRAALQEKENSNPPDVFDSEPTPEQIRERWSYKTAGAPPDKPDPPDEAKGRFTDAISAMAERKKSASKRAQTGTTNRSELPQTIDKVAEVPKAQTAKEQNQRIPIALKYTSVPKELQPIRPLRLQPPTRAKSTNPQGNNSNG